MSVRMRKSDGGGASFGGKEYPADAKGIVTVPGEAVAALEDHGFEVAKDEIEKPGKTDTEIAREAKIAELLEAVKAAKIELKGDKGNADKKAALDAAVGALNAFKAEPVE